MLPIFAEAIVPFHDYANENRKALRARITRVGLSAMRSRHMNVDTKEQGDDITMITIVKDIDY